MAEQEDFRGGATRRCAYCDTTSTKWQEEAIDSREFAYDNSKAVANLSEFTVMVVAGSATQRS
ncbi:hypothetical protein CASFOL_037648 [Castilleja foliolosa]|uniref:Uncharacterized protein n=1 Tax=Castilleja foliolosa TaxID=1961234 RepID=A0ABD3BNJ9_9LAMI